MDGLQKQVNNLSNKVEQLQRMVEQIGEQIAAMSTDKSLATMEKQERIWSEVVEFSPPNDQPVVSSFMEHKDILNDEASHGIKTSPSLENTISADIQIRRLTAQLTAAYNRIAALEEQLLNHHRINI